MKAPDTPYGIAVIPNIHDGAFLSLSNGSSSKSVWYPYRFEPTMGKDDDRKGVSRRELLTFWRRPLKELAETRPSPPPAPVQLRPSPLRPPGALKELFLIETCVRCGKCVETCPAEAILPLGPEWGAAFGTPYIDARRRPCVLCTDLKCTHVCPSGALQPVHRNEDVAMGTAVLDPLRCVTYSGQRCDLCLNTCPMPGTIVMDASGRVRVREQSCTGCGLCEHVCPTEPTSIRVVPRV
jgi:ferredoxin-type protein NapG